MKLKATYETEVYISTGGYLCIRQADPMGGDDSTIMLSEEQARLIVPEIQRLLQEGDWWSAQQEAKTD